MIENSLLLLIPVLLPIFCGLFLLCTKWLKTNRKKLCLFVVTVLSINMALVLFLALQGEADLFLFSLTESLPIYFHYDRVGVLFSVLVSFIWLCVGVYSFQYMKKEEKEPRFFGFFLIILGVLMGLDFSGNLITMYIFYELVTLLSVPLVLHTQSKEAIMAGVKYLIYSFCGAFLGLVGIFFTYHNAESLTFTPGGVLDPAKLAGNEGFYLVVVFLMLIGFGTKAGMFPLHGWLPTAHPVAPAPASALLSGIITKSGVLAVIRVVYYIVGSDFLRGTWVQITWIVLALITVFMGSMMAYKEPVLKKRLAYSTISQVSYILFGLALLQQEAFIGALSHLVFHAIIKNALFLGAGAIIFRTGIKRVEEMSGIGKKMPVTIWCFTLVSLGLIGIPPLSGFISKWHLAQGALESSIPVLSWLGPVVLLLSALLTAGYLLPITIRGFFPGESYDYKSCGTIEKASDHLVMPMILLAALTLLFGLFPNGLLSFIGTIAESIF